MDRNFAAITIFTLLFAVSTARISLDSKPTDFPLVQSDCGSNSLPEAAAEASNLLVLPTDTDKSRSDRDDQVQKSDNDRMFRVDLTPRSDFAKFHAINRRFFDQHRVHRVPISFDHSRPYRKTQHPFVIPHRSEVKSTGKFDAQSFHRHSASSRIMKFKHDYEHHHHRHQQHQHRHIHHNRKNDEVSMLKRKFVDEKPKSSVHEHKEKTREHEASTFMKSIRKFLKYTFD